MKFVRRVSKWVDDLLHPKGTCKQCGATKRRTEFQAIRGYDYRGRMICEKVSGICLDCWPEASKRMMNRIFRGEMNVPV